MNSKHADIPLMRTVNNHMKISLNGISETLYLTVASAYILKQFLEGTLFNIPWPEDFEKILHTMVLAAVISRIGCAWECARKELLVCALAFIMFKFSWLSTGYTFLLNISLLAMGAVGISYRKILKAGFWTGLYVQLLALLGSLAGSIPDLIYPSGQYRHSFGIIYPTDFAAHVTFLALAGWVLYGGTGLVFPLVCVVSLASFVYYYCAAKCSTVVLSLFAVAVVFLFLGRRHREKPETVYPLEKFLDSILTYMLPFCSVLMIGLACFYNAENVGWSRINELLTNRLSLGHIALDKYGVKLFGTAFDQVGYGGGIAWSFAIEYNFIDSSYVLVLVRYGLAVLMAVCIQYIWLEKKVLRSGHRKLAMAVALVAVHSMVEHHLLEQAYNLFLLVPFADFVHAKQETIQSCGRIAIKKKRLRCVCALAFAGGAAVAMSFPRIVTYMKTIVDVLQLDSPERHLLFISLTTVYMLIAGMLSWLLFKFASAFIRGNSLPKSIYVNLGILSLAVFGSFIYGEQVIHYGQTEYFEVVEKDKPVIDAILGTREADGRLYIDCIPEIYRREFVGIASVVLPAECLALRENTTLIIEDSNELLYLMEAGYLYGELASGHAVYTNSATAREILEREGVTLTAYYSRQETVNLKETALQNNLALTENGTLLLDDYGGSLWYGLETTVYHGVLRVEYKLRLLNCSASGSIVGTASVSSDWGAKIWKQADITLGDFDENGDCTYIIDANLSANCPNMVFLLTVPEGVQMEVLEIRYGKVAVLGKRKESVSP